MKHKTLFLVILTWLQQLQQYFYSHSEWSENCNWSDYANYCPTVSYLKDAPLANIRFAKCDNKEELVKSVGTFRPKKDHKAVLLLDSNHYGHGMT